MSEETKKLEKRFIEDLKDSANKIWLAGLGALSMTDAEGTTFFKNLVNKGREFESLGMDQIKKVSDTLKDALKENFADKVKEKVNDTKTKAETVWGRIEGTFDNTKNIAESIMERIEDRFDEKVASVLNRFGVPTGEEISKLSKRVEDLAQVVENIKIKSETQSEE